MGLNNILQKFLPKDKVFYSIFEQMTSNLDEMGETLVQSLQTEDFVKRAELFQQIENFEHKNDSLTHKVFIELGQNFITPFDREDIHQLAMALDDVADYIYAATKKITLYNLIEIDDYMRELSIIIKRYFEFRHIWCP